MSEHGQLYVYSTLEYAFHFFKRAIDHDEQQLHDTWHVLDLSRSVLRSLGGNEMTSEYSAPLCSAWLKEYLDDPQTISLCDQFCKYNPKLERYITLDKHETLARTSIKPFPYRFISSTNVDNIIKYSRETDQQTLLSDIALHLSKQQIIMYDLRKLLYSAHKILKHFPNKQYYVEAFVRDCSSSPICQGWTRV